MYFFFKWRDIPEHHQENRSKILCRTVDLNFKCRNCIPDLFHQNVINLLSFIYFYFFVNDRIYQTDHQENRSKILCRTVDLLQVWVEGFYEVDFRPNPALVEQLIIFTTEKVSQIPLTLLRFQAQTLLCWWNNSIYSPQRRLAITNCFLQGEIVRNGLSTFWKLA